MSVEMPSLSSLERSKRVTIRSIVALKAKVDAGLQENPSEQLAYQIGACLQTLKSNIDGLRDLNAEILEATDFSDKTPAQIESMEAKITSEHTAHVLAYSLAKGNHSALVSRLTKPADPLFRRSFDSTIVSDSSPPHPLVKLPDIPVPKFDGKSENFTEWHSLFSAMIDSNENLKSIQKLYYLKQALVGDAAYVLKDYVLQEGLYDDAWRFVNDRYYNRRMIIANHFRDLLDMPAVGLATLRDAMDRIQAIIRSLRVCGLDVEKMSPLITYIVVRKLPERLRTDWENSNQDYSTYPSFQPLSIFLQSRCFSYESSQNVTSQKSGPIKASAPSEKGRLRTTLATVAKARTTTSSSTQSRICSLCSHEHDIWQCPDFLGRSVSSRLTVTREMRLCANCLRKGHLAIACRSSKCKRCGKAHNTLLHRDVVSSPLPSTSSTATACATAAEKSVCTVATKSLEVILLPSAVVNILIGGRMVLARTLIDPCSQANLVSEQFVRVNRIPVSSSRSTTTLASVSSVPITAASHVSLTLKSRFDSYKLKIQANIVGRIPYEITAEVMKKIHDMGTDLQLADCMRPGETITKVDILIGGEHANQILLGNKRFVDGLCFEESQFGWIAQGPLSRVPVTHPLCCNLTVEVEEILAKFWEVEEVIVPRKDYSEHEMCDTHFNATHSRLPDGKFQVRLPLKDSVEKLANTYHQAHAALRRSETKLDNSTRSLYVEFMKEYLNLGHMEPSLSHPSTHYVIPHLPVLRPDSTTTKLRVVFNASAKNNSGISLNEILMTGPTIQPELFEILLRFRTYPIAFSADLSKMYRQISMHPEDRYLQSIIWRNEPEDTVRHFQLTTLTYGTAPASFIATKCLEEVGKTILPIHPEISRVISTEFYMDDLLTGANSVSEAIEKSERIRSSLKQASFELRKFVSNSKEFLNAHHHALLEELRPLQFASTGTAKILGLCWQPEIDSFSISAKTADVSRVTLTKRVISSLAARIFDPLGLAAPITIRAKILLQDLWREGKGWDEPASSHTCKTFCCYYKELPDLVHFRIRRPYSIEASPNFKMFAFCDASEKAYGASVYLQPSGAENAILVCAKAKVAPLKSLTIPRLELLAMVLLAKLVDRVRNILNVDISNVFAFSDSTIALAWIKGPSSKYKEFVRNRINFVVEKIPNEQWAYVKTSENPADLLTRGVSVNSLIGNSLWINGPPWLSDRTIYSIDVQYPETLPEQLTTKIVNTVVSDRTFNEEILTRFSNFNMLLRVLARMFDFLVQLHPPFQKYNSLDRRTRATYMLCHISQKVFYEAEMSTIRAGQPLPLKSPLLALNPVLDEYGILRVGGRLRNSFLSYATKHPIILSRDSKLVTLLIRHIHESFYHATQSFTLAHLQSQFWIKSGASRLVKKAIFSCVWCTRMKGKSLTQIMGDLPSDRMCSSRPFASVGVDYAGPFSVKCTNHRSIKHLKYYAAFFVCCATRATHIEPVASLTSMAFIATLQRFAARRGLPARIRSDNATNFVGSHNAIAKHCSDLGIDWQFIPPRSPHHGGLWEAAVKAAKKYFVSATKGISCDVEKFTTVLTLVEAILNSRPLYQKRRANSEITDVITPGHFLVGSNLLEVPQPDLADIALSDRLETHRATIRSFWTQWSKNYLALLQTRSKWKTTSPNIQLGDVVLLKDGNAPPLKWPLARVIEVLPDQSGQIRIVTVTSNGSKFRRSVQNLVLLPIEAGAATLPAQ